MSSGHPDTPPIGDRGPDREVPVTPNYEVDPDYWKQYHPYFNSENKKNKEEHSFLAENKGGYDDLLIDLLPQNHRYDIDGRSARAELEVIAKDPKARQFLTNGLDRIKDGTLTSLQQKELRGFKRLKEYKFGRKGIRVIINPGKKVADLLKSNRVLLFPDKNF